MVAARVKSSASWWWMLPGRTALFVIWQAVIALILTLMGSASGWQEAAGWWPIVAFLTNVVSIFWLWSLFHAEGRRFLHIFQIKRETLKKDVVFLLAMLVISGPVAMGPNILLATWLFGDQQAALDLLLRPLPFWAVLFSIVLWPLTQSFAELPFYFGYLMPRLERQSGRWTAVLASAFWLGAQHAALPLIFNGRFFLWRLLMFLPFALLVAVVLNRKPQLLPFMVVIHGLMDLTMVLMIPTAG